LVFPPLSFFFEPAQPEFLGKKRVELAQLKTKRVEPAQPTLLKNWGRAGSTCLFKQKREEVVPHQCLKKTVEQLQSFCCCKKTGGPGSTHFGIKKLD